MLWVGVTVVVAMVAKLKRRQKNDLLLRKLEEYEVKTLHRIGGIE